MIESPDIDPHKHSQLIFDKRTEGFNGKKEISTSGARTIGCLCITIEPRYLTPYIKINLKCIIVLNSKCKTISFWIKTLQKICMTFGWLVSFCTTPKILSMKENLIS